MMAYAALSQSNSTLNWGQGFGDGLKTVPVAGYLSVDGNVRSIPIRRLLDVLLDVRNP